MKSFVFSLLLAVAISVSVIAQTVPSGMTYQGRLTDASNAPVPDGTGYEIEVRLWSANTGGTLLWGTRYTGVPLKNGAFNIILGSGGTPIPGASTTDLNTAFRDPSVHLGLTTTKSATGAPILSPNEILPRQQIFSTPFAFRAETAATAASAASVQADGVLSNAIKDGEVKAADIAAGAINLSHIAANSLTSSAIAGSSIDLDRLAPAARPLGSGQTWQNMSASRAENTTYQNTTGRPIQVIWSSRGNNSAGVSSFAIWVSQEDVPWTDTSDKWVLVSESQTMNFDNAAGSLSAIVPPSSFYRLVFIGTNSSRTRYVAELK